MPTNSRSAIFTAAMAGALLLGLGGAASAALYSYTGTVELCPSTTIPCGQILFVGDSVTGTIEVDDAALQPDSLFFFGDITDFSFSFGLIDPLVDSGNSSIVRGEIETDANLQLVDGYLHVFAPDFPIPSAPPLTLTVDLATGTWLALGYTDDPDLPTFVTASGTGSFTLIPVPPALMMLASAIVLLGFMRRRSPAP